LGDKALVSLKGGCNLRFFFQSVRYSENIDFDVTTVGKGTLIRKVDDLLASPVLVAPLKAQGFVLVDASKPKQTETTQRWKIGLRSEPSGILIRTKIEFSRRGAIKGALLEALSSSVTSSYAMPPFLATHYPVREAIVQKIHALADRRELQPRDVFDLNYLFPWTPELIALTREEKEFVLAAIERAMSISFDDYSAKVVAYLEPEQGELFASADDWNLMQEVVVNRLTELDA